MTDNKQPQELVEVTIWGNHNHQGKPVEPGSKIKVRPDQKTRLDAAGVTQKPENAEVNHV